MRKVHILKAIVDFIWIVSIPIIPITIIAIPFIFFNDEFLNFLIKSNGVDINIAVVDLPLKIIIAVTLVFTLLIYYCIYLFRKILAYFLRLKMFDDFVISSFNKIGNLLVVYGILSITISFLTRFFYQQKVTIEFGINSNLVILCLGLFFMVLSEIFRISKTIKQENDLTV